MFLMAPPDQDVRALEQFVTDALVRIVQAGLDDFPALGLERLQPFSDGSVDVLGINLLGSGIYVGRAFRPHDHLAPACGSEEVQVHPHPGRNHRPKAQGCAPGDAVVRFAGLSQRGFIHGTSVAIFRFAGKQFILSISQRSVNPCGCGCVL